MTTFPDTHRTWQETAPFRSLPYSKCQVSFTHLVGGGNLLSIHRNGFPPRVHPFIPLVSAPRLSCLFFRNPYVRADISLYAQKKCEESCNPSLPRWACVCLLGSNSLVFKLMSNRPARLPLLVPRTETPAHFCVCGYACTHTHAHAHPLTCMRMRRSVLETVESSL